MHLRGHLHDIHTQKDGGNAHISAKLVLERLLLEAVQLAEQAVEQTERVRQLFGHGVVGGVALWAERPAVAHDERTGDGSRAPLPRAPRARALNGGLAPTSGATAPPSHVRAHTHTHVDGQNNCGQLLVVTISDRVTEPKAKVAIVHAKSVIGSAGRALRRLRRPAA